MYKNYVDLLRYILDECEYIGSVVTPSLTREQVEAVVRAQDGK